MKRSVFAPAACFVRCLFFNFLFCPAISSAEGMLVPGQFVHVALTAKGPDGVLRSRVVEYCAKYISTKSVRGTPVPAPPPSFRVDAPFVTTFIAAHGATCTSSYPAVFEIAATKAGAVELSRLQPSGEYALLFATGCTTVGEKPADEFGEPRLAPTTKPLVPCKLCADGIWRDDSRCQ